MHKRDKLSENPSTRVLEYQLNLIAKESCWPPTTRFVAAIVGDRKQASELEAS